MADRTIHSVTFNDLTDQEFQHLLDVAATFTPLNTTVPFWTGAHDYLDALSNTFTEYDRYNDIEAYDAGRNAAATFVTQRLDRHKLTQYAILNMLAVNTHGIWSEQFVRAVNLAFNTHLEPKNYNDPELISLDTPLDQDKHTARGLASFDLAPMLCEELHVSYAKFLHGRARLVRNCVFALREAGFGNTPDTL